MLNDAKLKIVSLENDKLNDKLLYEQHIKELMFKIYYIEHLNESLKLKTNSKIIIDKIIETKKIKCSCANNINAQKVIIEKQLKEINELKVDKTNDSTNYESNNESIDNIKNGFKLEVDYWKTK
jgi:hypothetical protein